MIPLREAWAALAPKLKVLESLSFSAGEWAVLERLHTTFNDRDAHTHLPLPIARFRDDAAQAIYAHAQQFDDVLTDTQDASWPYARLYNDDVDAMMAVLVPQARYRKGHTARGRFGVPQPHGLHTDHSLEDPAAAGEPICIARIETLGTHYLTGDYRTHDTETQSMIKALRYWIAVPEGQPDEIFDELLRRGTLKTIPVNHVMLMVAGNSSENTQVTQHIAANPPEGGMHSAFFQRQYRLER
jgi:hypothetical protein